MASDPSTDALELLKHIGVDTGDGQGSDDVYTEEVIDGFNVEMGGMDVYRGTKYTISDIYAASDIGVYEPTLDSVSLSGGSGSYVEKNAEDELLLVIDANETSDWMQLTVIFEYPFGPFEYTVGLNVMDRPVEDPFADYEITFEDDMEFPIIASDDTTGIKLSLLDLDTPITENVEWSTSTENAVVENGYLKAAAGAVANHVLQEYSVIASIDGQEAARASFYVYDATKHVLRNRETSIVTLDSGDTYVLFDWAVSGYIPPVVAWEGCVWRFGDSVLNLYYATVNGNFDNKAIAQQLERAIYNGEALTSVEWEACPHLYAYEKRVLPLEGWWEGEFWEYDEDAEEYVMTDTFGSSVGNGEIIYSKPTYCDEDDYSVFHVRVPLGEPVDDENIIYSLVGGVQNGDTWEIYDGGMSPVIELTNHGRNCAIRMSRDATHPVTFTVNAVDGKDNCLPSSISFTYMPDRIEGEHNIVELNPDQANLPTSMDVHRGELYNAPRVAYNLSNEDGEDDFYAENVSLTLRSADGSHTSQILQDKVLLVAEDEPNDTLYLDASWEYEGQPQSHTLTLNVLEGVKISITPPNPSYHWFDTKEITFSATFTDTKGNPIQVNPEDLIWGQISSNFAFADGFVQNADGTATLTIEGQSEYSALISVSYVKDGVTFSDSVYLRDYRTLKEIHLWPAGANLNEDEPAKVLKPGRTWTDPIEAEEYWFRVYDGMDISLGEQPVIGGETGYIGYPAEDNRTEADDEFDEGYYYWIPDDEGKLGVYLEGEWYYFNIDK